MSSLPNPIDVATPLRVDRFVMRLLGWYPMDGSPGIPQLGTPVEIDLLDAAVCERCDGDGKAHGSDRPFEWHGPNTYPGPCPVCKGSGKAVPA